MKVGKRRRSHSILVIQFHDAYRQGHKGGVGGGGGGCKMRRAALPSRMEKIRQTARWGGPSFGVSTPNHWTSMAARCAPKQILLRGGQPRGRAASRIRIITL